MNKDNGKLILNQPFDLRESIRSIEEMRRENNRALKRLFSGQIKQSFLIRVLEIVRKKYCFELFELFKINPSIESMITGQIETMDYDVCKHIVGIHKVRMIFVKPDERNCFQNNDAYVNGLVDEVMNALRLRFYGDVFFRKQQMTSGDNFIYFPILYYLFVITIKANSILQNSNFFSFSRSFYNQIFNKSLATLSLIEDGFHDSAYSCARSAIEYFINFLIINKTPNVIKEFGDFIDYDVRKENCDEGYTEEFRDKYTNRINKNEKSMINYLHFGWVDKIENYHQIVVTRPYSFGGLIKYLKKDSDEEKNILLERLEKLHKMCHSYSHGNISICRYPLLHYFELSQMLYYVLRTSYVMLCKETNISVDIEKINVLDVLDNEFKLLLKQYNERTTENFEQYYKS